MAKDQRNVEAITPMEEDFAKWYTDICLKAELVDYASVKGFLILRPYGYAIWENIQKYHGRGVQEDRPRERGHAGADSREPAEEGGVSCVAGFAPEVAWVTHGRQRTAGGASGLPPHVRDYVLRPLEPRAAQLP